MYKDYFGLRLAPFSVTPDPDLYYTNRVYQEALATLQYSIMERKGFIVITGEVGTGKTTLLRKLLHSLAPTVHTVFIVNSPVNFDDLLRLTLKDLDLAHRGADRITMIETLNHYLIGRLQEDRIVCLLIDEAQDLSTETLEGLRLLSNMETDKEKLLQIALVGHPDLEKKLAQPALRQLKQRVALHYRLAALGKREIVPYINCRLKAAGYPGSSLFRPEAVDQIAFYSEGIPRLVNIICDNALLAAYAESRREVSEEMIKEVALDLRLSERMRDQILPMESPILREPREVSADAQVKIVADDVWQSKLRLNVFPAGLENAPTEQPKKRGVGLGVGALLALVLVGGSILEYSDHARSYLAELASNLKGFEERSADNVGRSQQQQGHDSSQAEATASSVQPALTEDGHSETGSTSEENGSGAFQASLPTTNKITGDNPGELGESKRIGAKERSRNRIPNDPDLQKKRMELEIQKALHNRAISNVAVSLVDGTAYLDGEVATERQKSMAERAARSVPDVVDVKNRLTVKSF